MFLSFAAMKKVFTYSILAILVVLINMNFLMAQSSQIEKEDLRHWPKGTSPQEIGKRVAEHFIASPHANFGRPTPPKVITYPETCTWYGALTFAKETGDKKMQEQLAL